MTPPVLRLPLSLPFTCAYFAIMRTELPCAHTWRKPCVLAFEAKCLHCQLPNRQQLRCLGCFFERLVLKIKRLAGVKARVVINTDNVGGGWGPHKRIPAASVGFAKTQSHALRRQASANFADKLVNQLAMPVGDLVSQFSLSKVRL
jgi:hypothetical protein